MVLVDAADVIYATIDEGLITVVSTLVEGLSNYRIEELQSHLDPHIFWRAHRSYLVNINRIREVAPWFKSSYRLLMSDRRQTEIPVSRAQTKRLRELFKLSPYQLLDLGQHFLGRRTAAVRVADLAEGHNAVVIEYKGRGVGGLARLVPAQPVEVRELVVGVEQQGHALGQRFVLHEFFSTALQVVGRARIDEQHPRSNRLELRGMGDQVVDLARANRALVARVAAQYDQRHRAGGVDLRETHMGPSERAELKVRRLLPDFRLRR